MLRNVDQFLVTNVLDHAPAERIEERFQDLPLSFHLIGDLKWPPLRCDCKKLVPSLLIPFDPCAVPSARGFSVSVIYPRGLRPAIEKALKRGRTNTALTTIEDEKKARAGLRHGDG